MITYSHLTEMLVNFLVDSKTSVKVVNTYRHGYVNEYTGDYNQLLYLRARYYVPYLNQFIQPDTIVPDPYIPADWNKYTYVRNNPINYTDPSGHIACKDIISSWRPVFIALHLCNPQEEPTLTEKEIEFYESFDDTFNGNFVTCGVGYISYGYICVPTTVEKTLGGYCGDERTGPLLAKNKDDKGEEDQLQEKM